MRRARLFATLLSGLGLVAVIVAARVTSTSVAAQNRAASQDRSLAAVRMNPDAITVRILFGLRDKQTSQWSGQILLADGEVLHTDIWRPGQGDRVEDNTRFQLQTRTTSAGRRRVVTENGLLLTIASPPAGSIRLSTNHGDFQFRPGQLISGGRQLRLEGRVGIDMVASAVELAATEREEDFPAAAVAPDGTVHVVYVEHTHRGPADLIRLQEAPEEFSSFRPEGGGDRLMVTHLNGQTWSRPVAVTDEGLDLWRPAITVAGDGTVWVVWSQNVAGNWDLYARSVDGTTNRLSAVIRVTSSPGADVSVVAATDASGKVWLAWQGWRQGDFDIHVGALEHDGMRIEGRLRQRGSNEWSPAIAADKRGNVYVAYDSYAEDDYDVRLATIATDSSRQRPQVISVADSRSFEVRPSVVCDAEDRVWVAWEERTVNWGKDDWGAIHRGPGAALYRGGSTVKVACLEDGQWQQTAGDLLGGFRPPTMKNMNGYPRLAADADGRVWLALRHRGQRRAPAGTFWESFVTSYEGTAWSPPTLVTHSDNLLDNRPGLIGRAGGQLLAIYSGDGRNRYASRPLINNHLYAATVASRAADVSPPRFKPLEPDGVESVTVVHANERQDVARIRRQRFNVAGATYRLMRGEFHRHTEISGDGGGDGSLQDMWRYALDAASMDWLGNGDHDNGGGREYTWWLIQKTTDIFHHPPNFVPMFTYERSVVYPDGHRNVMFAERGIRTLPRLRARPEENKTNNVSLDDTPMLYRYLRHFGGICAVHTSATNMGTDWRDNDPVAEPIVEIYQGDRHNYESLGAPRSATPQTAVGGYEPAGFIWNALQKGYRLGFQASSDHISTHISYAVAVVTEPTRQGILDAFKQRHCYGATDNISLLVTCDDHLMGDEFTTSKPPSLGINVVGTAAVAKVTIIKDFKFVHTAGFDKPEVNLRWTDGDPTPGETSLYYVRIEQADGQLAWASPMWIKYEP